MNGEHLPKDCYFELNMSECFKQLRVIELLLNDFCRKVNIDKSKIQVNPRILKDIIIRTEQLAYFTPQLAEFFHFLRAPST